MDCDWFLRTLRNFKKNAAGYAKMLPSIAQGSPFFFVLHAIFYGYAIKIAETKLEKHGLRRDMLIEAKYNLTLAYLGTIAYRINQP